MTDGGIKLNKTVRLFNENFETSLTDIKGLKFLDYEETGVDVRANTLEVKGKDGVLIGNSTFGAFNLVLRFFYRGTDNQDYELLKTRLRGLLFRREPYYIVHSDMPGKKYAVYCSENAITSIGDKFGEFAITFVVYKGYSESLKDTSDINFLSDNWQFESGLITDKDISYKHNNKRFSIWNGSYDTIDPLNHKLIIKIKASAPNGFKMTNHTTGETFEYKGELKDYQTLVLHGVNPTISNNRVGINTNHEWITLAPGMNNIEIDGINVTNVSVEFEFNFIYR